MTSVIKRRKIVDVNPSPKTKMTPEPPPKKEKSVKQEPPKPQQQPKKKKMAYFNHFEGQYLVFQLKSGMLVKGTVEKEEAGYVMVVDATIFSKNYQVEVDWVRIERMQIGHFHPEAKKLIPIAEIEKEEVAHGKTPDWQDKEAYREYTSSLIAELKESGKSLKEIAQALDESGVKTRTGKDTWSTATISNILKKE